MRVLGRRIGTVTTVGAAVALSLAAAAAGAREVLRGQARVARRAIGKELGEVAHRADRVYKSKHGAPIDLLVLGDSVAAGLGAEKPKHTLGAQLASRTAKATGRAVRLRTEAVVGSESSVLAAQLGVLPGGYRPDVAVIVVGGNDVTHRVRVAESTRHLADAVEDLRGRGAEVVVGTCPDLGLLLPVPQPLRSLAGRASRQLATAQLQVATALGAHAVSLATVVGPFFAARPDEMFALDQFHPSGAGYRRTAKALLPSVLAALGYREELPFGHHAPVTRAPATSPAGSPADGR